MAFYRPNRLPGLRVVSVDHDSVERHRATPILRATGHCVFSAYDRESALALLHQYPGVELLITKSAPYDLGGRELIRLARDIRPDLPILCIGGTPDADARFPSHVALLSEPFSPTQLLTAIAALMAGQQTSKLRDRRQRIGAPSTNHRPDLARAVDLFSAEPLFERSLPLSQPKAVNSYWIGQVADYFGFDKPSSSSLIESATSTARGRSGL